MGPILDTIVVSLDVAGMLCEELGWCVNMSLLCPFTSPEHPTSPLSAGGFVVACMAF
jgi:hypothetical protein